MSLCNALDAKTGRHWMSLVRMYMLLLSSNVDIHDGCQWRIHMSALGCSCLCLRCWPSSGVYTVYSPGCSSSAPLPHSLIFKIIVMLDPTKQHIGAKIYWEPNNTIIGGTTIHDHASDTCASTDGGQLRLANSMHEMHSERGHERHNVQIHVDTLVVLLENSPMQWKFRNIR